MICRGIGVACPVLEDITLGRLGDHLHHLILQIVLLVGGEEYFASHTLVQLDGEKIRSNHCDQTTSGSAFVTVTAGHGDGGFSGHTLYKGPEQAPCAAHLLQFHPLWRQHIVVGTFNRQHHLVARVTVKGAKHTQRFLRPEVHYLSINQLRHHRWVVVVQHLNGKQLP